MMNHAEEAKRLFSEGYNCAQSAFAAFCDETGLSLDTALRLSSAFGGGMGRMREVCGAVTGMFMVVGMKFGYTDPTDGAAKAELYELVRSLAAEFERKHGSIICRELLGLEKGQESAPAEPSQKYPHDDHCACYVACAAEIVDALLRRKGGSRIAVACDGTLVSEHFGHCGNFMIFDERDGAIVSFESVLSPGHESGALPQFLADRGVQIVLSGGMGSGAIDGCHSRGMAVIIGARGDAREAAEAYLRGDLQSTGSVCHSHQHHSHEGGCGHKCGD